MDEHMAETFDQKYEREAAEADACLARYAERRRLEEQPEPEAEQPQRTVTMIDAAERRMRAFAVSMTEELAEVAGATTGRLESRIIKLEREIAQMKAAKPDSLKGVVPLRGRDVA